MRNLNLYDPLFSDKGHFIRYINYIIRLTLNANLYDNIIIFNKSDQITAHNSITKSSNYEILDNIQERLNNSLLVSKIFVNILSFIGYVLIIRKINNNKCPTLFLSNGTLPFWIAVIFFIKGPYYVSVISIKWIESKQKINFLFKIIYKKFLKNAEFLYTTERIYLVKLKAFNKNTFFLPERFLANEPTKKFKLNLNKELTLSTVGTISSIKNPVNFIKLLNQINSNYTYNIIGKSNNNLELRIKSEISGNNKIFYLNSYVNQSEYKEILEKSDIIVIPYDEDYSNYMTSGVLWDAIENKKIVLCPNKILFRHYILGYNIGYIYDKNNLQEILDLIITSKNIIISSMDINFKNLYQDYSFEKCLDYYLKPHTS